MARKKWTAREDSHSASRLREKRKWQIALRRYVLEGQPSIAYAPYFGLDIPKMREWFEIQFQEGLNWENFGENWQFEHIIPVALFDFNKEEDLRLCWNFTNISIEPAGPSGKSGPLDLLAAKSYFRELFQRTGYALCHKMVERIEKLESSELKSSEKQFKFLSAHKNYLDQLENFSAFEFELLNRGRSLEEVNQELAALKKIKI